jgi:hypothetical protein
MSKLNIYCIVCDSMSTLDDTVCRHIDCTT